MGTSVFPEAGRIARKTLGSVLVLSDCPRAWAAQMQRKVLLYLTWQGFGLTDFKKTFQLCL